MYIMMTMSFPPNKVAEFAAQYAEFEAKYPPDVRVGKQAFSGVYVDEGGFHAVNTLEVPGGKMETIYANLHRQIHELFGKIEGARFDMKTILSPEEAIASFEGL